MACVFLELGQDVHIDGNIEEAVNNGVRRGYGDGYLRKSVVCDPLRRVNTGDNTPALLSVKLMPGESLRITVMPKGFGSENMSALKMLKPADGVEGVKRFILETVEKAGGGPQSLPAHSRGRGRGRNLRQGGAACEKGAFAGNRRAQPGAALCGA